MTTTHLCNIFFERELASLKTLSLAQLFNEHPLSLQLQFLPLLYRKKGERVAVTEFPPHDYLLRLEQLGFSVEEIDLLDRPQKPFHLELWGASKAAESWAKGHEGSITLPDWDCVREIHSKVYSFAAGSPIPGSHLLANLEDAKAWASEFPGPKVLKKAFGASGSGHLRFEGDLPADVAASLFDQKLPLIGEPWVERIFDFSTQWRIQDTIDYIGATVLKVTPHGTYLGTLAGDENVLFKEHSRALQEHLDQSRALLYKIRALGFVGNLGIDSFVYLWEGKRRLRAVSEINARKTMGWAALTIQKQHFSDRILEFRFEKTKERGYLPSELNGRSFQRQLMLSFS